MQPSPESSRDCKEAAGRRRPRSTLKERVGEIMTPRVVGVASGTTVLEAITTMRRKDISCVIVFKGEQPAGIFTERSIVRYTATRGRGYCSTPIKECMSTPVLTVSADNYIYEAFNLIAHSKIRHLLVMDDGGRASGILTQSNLIDHLGFDYFTEIRRVDAIMSKIVFTVPPALAMKEALNEMADKTISCLVVAEDRRPVGVLTERDIVRLVADGTEFEGLTVADVMSRPLHTVRMETAVHEAAEVMRRHHIRRLVVVDSEGCIEGLTTQSNIVKGLEGKYIETLRDVLREKESALKSTSEDLHKQRVFLDNILRSAVDMGIVATDTQMRINYCNPAAQQMLGVRSEEVLGRDVREVHLSNDLNLERLDMGIRTCRKGDVHAFSTNGFGGNSKKQFQGRVSGVRDEKGEFQGMVLMLRDVTERRKTEEAIRKLAYYDMLTGLPNRIMFSDRLSLEMARSRRNDTLLAVMVMDLDRFKVINDTMGHQSGDRLLNGMACRLKELFRESDTVARMGGDEFLLIMPDLASPNDVELLTARIIAAMTTPFAIEGREIYMSVSIGAAMYPLHGRDEDRLIKVADDAMYRAKELGRQNKGSNACVASQ